MKSDFDLIQSIRRDLGDRLTILGHHYQSDAIIRHTDIQGDSLELARKIAGLRAEHIVFCGVYFMAESAAILKTPGQSIHIPDPSASCVMAETAPMDHLRGVLEKLTATGRRIIPLAYVNSSARVKGVCGEMGGSVCTSANAKTMLDWAMSQGDGVLFLPDRNLAVNTADSLGIPEKTRHRLDISGKGARVDVQAAARADLLIWPGTCPIHQRFAFHDDIEAIREKEPEALIVVHPECPQEVTSKTDGNGSTSYLIRYVDEAPDDSLIYMGTETNLVTRLAARYAGRKTIRPLRTSFCSNMGRITEEKLAAQLADIKGSAPVTVEESVAVPARRALETMLKVCA